MKQKRTFNQSFYNRYYDACSLTHQHALNFVSVQFGLTNKRQLSFSLSFQAGAYARGKKPPGKKHENVVEENGEVDVYCGADCAEGGLL